MQSSQQAVNYLNLKLTWEVIKSQIAPTDQDYALHVIGKTVIERNAEVYQEALVYAGILCDMISNITAASTPLSPDLFMNNTDALYLHSEANESLNQDVLELLCQVDLKKRDAFIRSKSRAQRFNEVAEAYQRHEKFKTSKVVQRILSSKIATSESESSARKQLTYADVALLKHRTIAAEDNKDNTFTAEIYNSYCKLATQEPQLPESEPIRNEDNCESNSISVEEDDFYSVEPSVPKIQNPKKQVIIARPISAMTTKQIIKPKIYDDNMSNYTKLVTTDFTEAFVGKIRSILEIEYRDILAKIEKMQGIIANMAKVNDLALSISQELLESTKKLTDADILNLKNQLLQAHGADTLNKTAKAPLAQDFKVQLLLKPPSKSTGDSISAPPSLTGNMSVLKCLPKIGDSDINNAVTLRV